MDMTMQALEKAYRELAQTEAVCRPRIDIQILTKEPAKVYQWGTMTGGSTARSFAIWMKSPIISEQEHNGVRTSARQITYSERGNIQGAQFYAIAGKVYESVKAKGLGREIPTGRLLQDIRDEFTKENSCRY
jgi:hypothetical protein